MALIVSVVFVVLGVAGLSVFGWLVWAPLALAPLSVGCLVAGLLVDWETLRGKPHSSTDR